MTTSYEAPAFTAVRQSPTRSLAAAVAVFLGGYLVTTSLSGQLAVFIAGYTKPGIEVVALVVLQAVFAVLVVIGGLLLAPGGFVRKLVAIIIVIALVIVALVLQAMRLSGDLGAASIPVSLTLANAYFMTALAVGAAWLIVRSARVGWLAMLLTVLLIPVVYVLVLADIPSALTQIAALALSGIVLGVIVIAGRPLRG